MLFRGWSGGPAAAVLAIAGSCFAASLCAAQTAGTAATEGPSGVQILSSDRMNTQDAALLSARQTDLQQAAEMYGYELSTGAWLQNQVQCRVLSDNLLMRFRQTRPNGAISLFTAIVPRDRKSVRIVPLLYRGVEAERGFEASLAVRDLINRMTAYALQLNPADAASTAQDSRWNDLADCFAAMAGSDPASLDWTGRTDPIVEIAPSADPHRTGVRSIAFSAVGPDIPPQDFEILFDGQAHVKTITVSARPLHAPAPVHTATEKSGPLPAVQPSTEKSPPAPVVQTSTVTSQPAPVVLNSPEPPQPAPAAQPSPETPQPTPAPQPSTENSQPPSAAQPSPEKSQPTPAPQPAPETSQPAPAPQPSPETSQPAPSAQPSPEKSRSAPPPPVKSRPVPPPPVKSRPVPPPQ